MDIPTPAQLVDRIDAFLKRHGMAETRLGRDATGEPNLIPSIRGGRSPTLDTLNRLAGFMAETDKRADEAASTGATVATAAGKSADLTASGMALRQAQGERDVAA